MRAVVQRVIKSNVSVDNNIIGEIKEGIMLLLGVEENDRDEDFEYIFKKVTNLRIFDDENGVMNKTIKDINGELLVISQFTLYGDARKGNRPSYVKAAKFENGKMYYEKFILKATELGIKTQHGEYGADMQVQLINNGPVTILLDSSRIF